MRKGENVSHIKSMKAVTYPDSGFYSFELMRDVDRGVSVVRENIRIRKFSLNNLGISSILTANNVSTNQISNASITRNKVNIVQSRIIYLFITRFTILKKARIILPILSRRYRLKNMLKNRRTDLKKRLNQYLNF